jgi:hypothetical protein
MFMNGEAIDDGRSPPLRGEMSGRTEGGAKERDVFGWRTAALAVDGKQEKQACGEDPPGTKPQASEIV